MQVDGNDNVRNIECLVLDTIEQNASDKIIKFCKNLRVFTKTYDCFGKYAAGSSYRIHAPNFKPHGVRSYMDYVCRLSPI